MQDQLHAAPFVEEALGNDGAIRRNRAEGGFAGTYVRNDLVRAAGVEPALPGQQCDGRFVVTFVDIDAQLRDFVRQFHGAAESFAVPKRNGRRRAVGIFDADRAGFDAANLPRVGSEQENVAGQTLNGEIFVEGADDVTVGFRDDRIVGRVGDGAPAGNGGDAGTAAGAKRRR